MSIHMVFLPIARFHSLFGSPLIHAQPKSLRSTWSGEIAQWLLPFVLLRYRTRGLTGSSTAESDSSVCRRVPDETGCTWASA